jgi:hypothetical protein
MTIIHHYLRKELLFLLSSLLALFFLASCQKQPSVQFGSTYTSDNSSANIVVVDSTTIDMSTVYTDSTATAATGFMMVGSYADPYLGQVNSRSYLQVAPPSSLPTLDPQLDTYDSIGFVMLFPKGNPYYGDTTVQQTYVVNQIDTLFQFGNFQNGWFSNSSLPIGPDLGSASVTIAPNFIYTTQNAGDTVKIRMDDNLGRQLYNMVYNKSDTLTSSVNFFNWFHGLCISPAAGSKGIIYGFKDSAIMRIYYRQNGVTSVTKYIDFAMSNKSFQFNNLRPDWTGSPIANLVKPTTSAQPPPLTPSSQTAHASYVQTIGGLNIKLTFPFLGAIAQRPDYIGLLRAQLTVIPLAGTFNTTLQLPPQVGIYTSDVHNTLISALPASGTSGAQTGNLSLNYLFPLNTYYTYDVTNFVKTQITNTNPGFDQTGLILSVPQPTANAAFRRLVVADQSYPTQQRVTLSVYYISLFPHQ